jgi:hypothetical protein
MLLDTLRLYVAGPALPMAEATAAILVCGFFILIGLWNPIGFDERRAEAQEALPYSIRLGSIVLWWLVPIALIFAFGLFKESYLKFFIVGSAAFCILLAKGIATAWGIGRGARAMPRELAGRPVASLAWSCLVLALCAVIAVPTLTEFAPRRRVIFFPGSTIGNFDPADAVTFLKNAAAVAGPGGGLLIGVDLKKDKSVLDVAYDDPQGVTAAFNLNLLARINRELGADFDVRAFRHRAEYVVARSRIEMHLESLRFQSVFIGAAKFVFERGETIHTENSYKYTVEEFRELAAQAAAAGLEDCGDLGV